MRETTKEEAIKDLKKIVKPDDTLYTILRHVSSSGMFRLISVYAIRKNKPVCLDWYIEHILGLKRDKRDGLRIGGTGMDMGYHIVYNLSRAMFNDNFICTGTNCYNNDHINGDMNREKHKHSDGGYALRQAWL